MLTMQFVQVNCTLHRGGGGGGEGVEGWPSSFPNDSEERSRSKCRFSLVCVCVG